MGKRQNLSSLSCSIGSSSSRFHKPEDPAVEPVLLWSCSSGDLRSVSSSSEETWSFTGRGGLLATLSRKALAWPTISAESRLVV